ncbi:MAG: hypothetical protein R3C49_08705 [Planctomycetaceae bacterium]
MGYVLRLDGLGQSDSSDCRRDQRKLLRAAGTLGRVHPFGHVARIHYDNTNLLLPRHIDSVLKHTDHEQVDRVFVIEEVWPKQYNLPPSLYAHYFGRKRSPELLHVRAICTDNGSVITCFPTGILSSVWIPLPIIRGLRRQAQQAALMYSTLFTPSHSSQTSDPTLSSAASFTTN